MSRLTEKHTETVFSDYLRKQRSYPLHDGRFLTCNQPFSRTSLYHKDVRSVVIRQTFDCLKMSDVIESCKTPSRSWFHGQLWLLFFQKSHPSPHFIDSRFVSPSLVCGRRLESQQSSFQYISDVLRCRHAIYFINFLK